jgi:hypothetical protein
MEDILKEKEELTKTVANFETKIRELEKVKLLKIIFMNLECILEEVTQTNSILRGFVNKKKMAFSGQKL